MSIENLKDSLPDYAKDIKLNLSTLAGDETLSAQQLWGAFLATALAARNANVIRAVEAEAAAKLSSEALNAAKAAAAIMAMNNIYYKFTGMMGDDYRALPAKLRMSVIGNPGVDKKDFELWSLAVSAVNGCQFCVQAHEAKLIADGFSREQIQTAVRIASVVHAAAAILDGEQALGQNFREAA
jgi:lipoyl-dependent peroxiredoxin subunit D